MCSLVAGIYLFFIIFGLIALVVILLAQAAVILYTFARDMSVSAMRIQGSKKLPELTPCKNKHYHLFLSRAHEPLPVSREPTRINAKREMPALINVRFADVWSTGQDAVAIIKRQLQLLLYDFSCFLDVDDLERIDDLELYIERTQVMLLYLSKGCKSRRVSTDALSLTTS